MTKVRDLKKRWMKDLEFREAYDGMAEEFTLADALIRARVAANMTQDDVAEKMQTSQSYIARLEGGSVQPSINALKRYADATGAKLRISLE